MLVVQNKSFALSDVLVLLVVNFQDSLRSNKAETSQSCSSKGGFFMFEEGRAKEHGHGGEEERAAEGPRHGDWVGGRGQVCCTGRAL